MPAQSKYSLRIWGLLRKVKRKTNSVQTEGGKGAESNNREGSSSKYGCADVPPPSARHHGWCGRKTAGARRCHREPKGHLLDLTWVLQL